MQTRGIQVGRLWLFLGLVRFGLVVLFGLVILFGLVVCSRLAVLLGLVILLGLVVSLGTMVHVIFFGLFVRVMGSIVVLLVVNDHRLRCAIRRFGGPLPLTAMIVRTRSRVYTSRPIAGRRLFYCRLNVFATDTRTPHIGLGMTVRELLRKRNAASSRGPRRNFSICRSSTLPCRRSSGTGSYGVRMCSIYFG